MISPLDFTDEQTHVYKLLYRKADFNTMLTKYTKEQLLVDSNPIFNLTDRKIRTIMDKFIKQGFLKVEVKGSKGNPTIYKIINMIDFNRQQYDDNMTAKRQQCDDNNIAIPILSEDERQQCDDNMTAKRQENDQPIKDKDKEYIYSEIEQIRSHYKGKKTKSDAYKKLPKILDKYNKEELIRCIGRYNLEVEEKRNNGFKTLQFKNESTFWNGGYIDYLDENYIDVQANNKSKWEDMV